MRILFQTLPMLFTLCFFAGCGQEGGDAYVPDADQMPATLSPEDQAAHDKAMEEDSLQ